jgi:hypothetical protein
MFAFCRSSPFGHGIVRMILCSFRSYWTSAGGPISNRSISFVAEPVTIITNRCSGSGSTLRIRTFVLPSLNVNESTVFRAAMSMISTFSIAASTV